jgi:hypothetical protein
MCQNTELNQTCIHEAECQLKTQDRMQEEEKLYV